MIHYRSEGPTDMDVYTLKSCDTCKKAIKWLATEGINANVFDIRTDGISKETLKAAISMLGWETVLNRRSTSWRQLDETQKQDIDANKALALIIQNPTLMKRPLFVTRENFIVGFNQTSQQAISA